MTPVEGSRTAIGDKCDGAGAQAARATGTASWVTVDTHAATAFGGRCACGAAGRWRARWWCRDVARATWLVRAWPWGPGLVPAFRWLCAPGGPLLALAYLIECDHRENARTIQLCGTQNSANAQAARHRTDSQSSTQTQYTHTTPPAPRRATAACAHVRQQGHRERETPVSPTVAPLLCALLDLSGTSALARPPHRLPSRRVCRSLSSLLRPLPRLGNINALRRAAIRQA